MTDTRNRAAPGDSDDALRDALVEMSFAIQDLLGQVGDRHQLSLTQTRLLGILRDREPGMLELGRHLHLEKSSVSGLIDRAQQRGLVQRRPDTDDGRAVNVSITPAGTAIAEQIQTALAKPLVDLLAPLAPRQRGQLTRLLRSLLDDR
jgi:MarR family transcriptional regulator, lower aerobic nicotinate degradation pathway regulator